jgi:hypothetical protein
MIPENRAEWDSDDLALMLDENAEGKVGNPNHDARGEFATAPVDGGSATQPKWFRGMKKVSADYNGSFWIAPNGDRLAVSEREQTHVRAASNALDRNHTELTDDEQKDRAHAFMQRSGAIRVEVGSAGAAIDFIGSPTDSQRDVFEKLARNNSINFERFENVNTRATVSGTSIEELREALGEGKSGGGNPYHDERGRFAAAREASDIAFKKTNDAERASNIATLQPSDAARDLAIAQHNRAAELHDVAKRAYADLGLNDAHAARLSEIHGTMSQNHRARSTAIAPSGAPPASTPSAGGASTLEKE